MKRELFFLLIVLVLFAATILTMITGLASEKKGSADKSVFSLSKRIGPVEPDPWSSRESIYILKI